MMFLHVLLLCAFPPLTDEHRLRKFYIVEQEERFSRTEAVKECRTNYTDLVTVYDQEDNIKLSKLLPETKAIGWIGASLGNCSMNWSNGDEVTYKKDFQMNCGETCCAAMKADGNWDPLQCNQTRQFICYEQDDGRASYNYTFIPENKTWFDAQLYCRENHADLATIRNEKENKRAMEARDKTTDSCWIGLLQDSVEWSDGGQSAYRNWSTGQLQSKEPEVFMSNHLNAQWLKTVKDDCYPLCYKSFIHVSEGNMSWENALDYCNTHQNTSGLLRIESKDDQIETERELKRQNISGPVWVGLRQSRLFGFWIWSNGLHVGPWTNWKEGRAPEHQTSHHCAALENVNGQYKWSDKDCRHKFRVLCEVK